MCEINNLVIGMSISRAPWCPKCVECNKEATCILEGSTYCEEHLKMAKERAQERRKAMELMAKTIGK